MNKTHSVKFKYWDTDNHYRAKSTLKVKKNSSPKETRHMGIAQFGQLT
jgi:hypothetical protein